MVSVLLPKAMSFSHYSFTELFDWYRSPLVSFLYERGWRQNFVWGGFPGPEREVPHFTYSL